MSSSSISSTSPTLINPSRPNESGNQPSQSTSSMSSAASHPASSSMVMNDPMGDPRSPQMSVLSRSPLADLNDPLSSLSPPTIMYGGVSNGSNGYQGTGGNSGGGGGNFANLPQFTGSAVEAFRAETHIRKVEVEAKLRGIPLVSKGDTRIILMFGKTLQGNQWENSNSLNGGGNSSSSGSWTTTLFGREFSANTPAATWFDENYKLWEAKYKKDVVRVYELTRMIERRGVSSEESLELLRAQEAVDKNPCCNWESLKEAFLARFKNKAASISIDHHISQVKLSKVGSVVGVVRILEALWSESPFPIDERQKASQFVGTLDKADILEYVLDHAPVDNHKQYHNYTDAFTVANSKEQTLLLIKSESKGDYAGNRREGYRRGPGYSNYSANQYGSTSVNSIYANSRDTSTSGGENPTNRVSSDRYSQRQSGQQDHELIRTITEAVVAALNIQGGNNNYNGGQGSRKFYQDSSRGDRKNHFDRNSSSLPNRTPYSNNNTRGNYQANKPQSNGQYNRVDKSTSKGDNNVSGDSKSNRDKPPSSYPKPSVNSIDSNDAFEDEGEEDGNDFINSVRNGNEGDDDPDYYDDDDTYREVNCIHVVDEVEDCTSVVGQPSISATVNYIIDGKDDGVVVSKATPLQIKVRVTPKDKESQSLWMIVDTGSGASLLSVEAFRSLPSEWKRGLTPIPEGYKRKFTSATNGPLKPIGRISIPLYMGNIKTKPIPLTVVSNLSSDIILGNDVLSDKKFFGPISVSGRWLQYTREGGPPTRIKLVASAREIQAVNKEDMSNGSSINSITTVSGPQRPSDNKNSHMWEGAKRIGSIYTVSELIIPSKGEVLLQDLTEMRIRGIGYFRDQYKETAREACFVTSELPRLNSVVKVQNVISKVNEDILQGRRGIKVQLTNQSSKEVRIPKGTRIAQVEVVWKRDIVDVNTISGQLQRQSKRELIKAVEGEDDIDRTCKEGISPQ